MIRVNVSLKVRAYHDTKQVIIIFLKFLEFPDLSKRVPKRPVHENLKNHPRIKFSRAETLSLAGPYYL